MSAKNPVRNVRQSPIFCIIGPDSRRYRGHGRRNIITSVMMLMAAPPKTLSQQQKCIIGLDKVSNLGTIPLGQNSVGVQL